MVLVLSISIIPSGGQIREMQSPREQIPSQTNRLLLFSTEFAIPASHIPLSQFSNGLLKFISCNTLGIPFIPSDIPATSTNVTKEPVCSCLANCLQALEALPDHSCSTISVESV
jgi:hypothetical protein